ncbi:hypothetical protein PK28_01740 [Hymenobacter sp. DG25B]|nr:hypothetical protein PK28_01740 [Hymenobacter sp. DG25B]
MPVELLRRYVAGDLPSADQHAIEAHTLVCPPCADILEGLAQTDAVTTDQALAELHQRLQVRVGTGVARRPMGGAWLQAAAAILLLVIAGTFFWTRPHRQPATSSPAKQAIVTRAPSATSPPEAAAPTATPAPTLAEEKVVAIVQPVSRPAAQKKEQARRTRYVATMRSKWRNVPPAPGPGARKAPVTAAQPAPDSGNYTAQAAPIAAPDSASTTTTTASKNQAVTAPESRKTATLPARRISGRLTDGPTGKALAGVAVHATGTTVQSKTNEEGRFELLVPAGVESLTFMAAGYRDNERILGPDSTLALTMTPLTGAGPRTVVPEGRGRDAKMPTIPDMAPTPAGGLAAFNQYVEREVHYPEKDPPAGTYSAKVAVKLRFIVAADGSLQDIKVIEPLSEEYDAEAIRLLKEGPAWYPAVVNGKRIAHKAQVSVIFRFDNR